MGFHGKKVNIRQSGSTYNWYGVVGSINDRTYLCTPFLGIGSSVQGVNWYYNSKTGNTQPVNFGLYKDAGINRPQFSTPLATSNSVATATIRTNGANNLVYYPFTNGGVFCTAGNIYWVTTEMRGNEFAVGAGYVLDLLPTPVGIYTQQYGISYSDATMRDSVYSIATTGAFNLPGKYKTVSGTIATVGAYRYPIFPAWRNGRLWIGQGYRFRSTYSISDYGSGKNPLRVIFKYPGKKSITNVGTFISGKSTTPDSLKIRIVYNLAGATTYSSWQTLLHSSSSAPSDWRYSSYVFPPSDTAGPIAIEFAASAHGGSTNYWQLELHSAKSDKLTYCSSFARTLSGGVLSNFGDTLFTFDYTLSTAAQVTGYCREFSMSSPFPGTKIYLKKGSSIVSSAIADSAGYYSIPYSLDKLYLVYPKKYDFDFTPQFIWTTSAAGGLCNTAAAVASGITQNFVSSSESFWWGCTANSRGKAWAYRRKISFATPHPIIPKDYTVKVPIQTGYLKTINSTAFFNESVSGLEHQIVYADGKTHCVWIGQDFNFHGATYDWASNIWTQVPNVCTSYSDGIGETDTHISPSLVYCKYNKRIFVTVSNHDTGTIRLYRSREPNSLKCESTCFSLGGYDNTYIQMLSYNKYIYLLFRNIKGTDVQALSCRAIVRIDASGDNPTLYSYITFLYPKNPIIKYKNSESNTGAMAVSLYTGGCAIDNSGRLHMVTVFHDNYGQPDQYGRAISYMYSPTNSTGEAGNIWYNAQGHTTAILQNATSTGSYPAFFMDKRYTGPTANPFVIYSHTPGESMVVSPKAKYLYFSNVSGLFLHPTQTYRNSRGDILNRPCFSFISTDSAESIYSECKLYFAMFNSSLGAATLATATPYKMGGWVVHTVSHLANGQWQKGWKNRHVGTMAIDNSPTIHIYGFVKPTDLKWGGGELGEWYSDNESGYYNTWNFRRHTDKSSEGIGMISCKKDFSNDTIEMIYGRGKDIIYYVENKPYDRFRKDCEDLRVVYSNRTSTAYEINRVLNFANYASSEVYFKLVHTIPTNWTYDTAGNYYLYYGRVDTAQVLGGPNPDNASSDPTKVMLFYDGFENYNNTSAMPIVNSGWYKRGTGNATFTVYNSLAEHTNKLFSGDKMLKHVNTSTAKVYLCHTVVESTSCVIRFGRFPGAGRSFVGFIHSAAGRFQYVFSKRYGFIWQLRASTLGSGGDTGWVDIGYATVTYYTGENRTHEDVFYINKYGVSIYDLYGNFVDGNSAFGRTYSPMRNKMTLHTANMIIIGQDEASNSGQSSYIDHIRYYKVLATPISYQVL